MAALVGMLLALWALALSDSLAENASQQALFIDFTVQPAMMVAPGDISMTFLIENRSNRPVQNIYLASADGLLSEPIGQLGAGESQTLVRPHAVTQEELDAGQVVYTISHDPQDESDEKVVYTLSVPIVKGEQQPGVAFTRQFSSQYAMPDGLMTVTYKIVNTGNVPLSALRIRDSLGDFTGRLEQLDVGGSKSFISRVTLSGDDLSMPVLEYAVPTGDEFSITLDPAPIHIADDHLITSFYVRQAEFNEDVADAILILSNLGNVDYSDITVWDDVYGGVIADEISLPSGARPVEVPYTYPLRGEGEYRWRITGANSAGQLLDLRTSTIVASNTPETQRMDISLTAQTATATTVSDGAIVNNGGTDVVFYGNTGSTAFTDDGETKYIFPFGTANATEQSYILKDGRFVMVDDKSNGIAAHRCWLNVSKSTANGARVLAIGIDDETSGIESMVNVPCSMFNDHWYSLDGRKFDKQPTKKGIYINNGKKVVVR